MDCTALFFDGWDSGETRLWLGRSLGGRLYPCAGGRLETHPLYGPYILGPFLFSQSPVIAARAFRMDPDAQLALFCFGVVVTCPLVDCLYKYTTHNPGTEQSEFRDFTHCASEGGENKCTCSIFLVQWGTGHMTSGEFLA